MATRKRDLQPDSQGRYRPRVGLVRSPDGTFAQARFNRGTDKREAERRYERIREPYEDCQSVCRTSVYELPPTGWYWPAQALEFARQLAEGLRTVSMAPHMLEPRELTRLQRIGREPLHPFEKNPDVEFHYAQAIEKARQLYPSIRIEPADPVLYAASRQRNAAYTLMRLQDLEEDFREEFIPSDVSRCPTS